MHNMKLLMKLRVFRFCKEEILTFNVLKCKKKLELLWSVCVCMHLCFSSNKTVFLCGKWLH